MASSNHDTLVYRLSQILIKLNQGEKLDPHSLADEFGVNLRTIQRDLNVRMAYLPLQKTNGLYHLEQAFLGKLNFKDIGNFANLAGVSGLFPSLSVDFLRDIFDQNIQSTLLVKGHNYEDLVGKEEEFRYLEQAIASHQLISFDYFKKDEKKQYSEISPYKLINHKGIWYLAALDGEKMKTFSFSKISHVHYLNSTFVPDKKREMALFDEDGIWFGDDKIEFVLKVSKEVAGYFKRRKLIANQVVEKELDNGDLILSAKVGHFNQVLPIVRYWMPHIQIVSPEKALKTMSDDLNKYLSA